MTLQRNQSHGLNRALPWMAAALLLLAAGNAHAQYRVFAWDNYENGTLSESLQYKYHAKPDNNSVKIGSYTDADAPPGILNGIAAVECGKNGLRFDATPEFRLLGVVNELTLDRRGLGATGRALYQADFYLTAVAEKGENLAVLADAKGDPTQAFSGWRNYRVGIKDGTSIFFSYTDGTKKRGEPVLVKTETLAGLNVSRPGWHRLQLIFEGQEKIICAVDGKPTAFSPILEPSLDQLQAGIMVTVPVGESRTYFADNLSIQWTPDDLPIPDSPWVNPMQGTMVTTSAILPAGQPASSEPSSPAAAPAMGMPAAAPPSAPAPAVQGTLNWFISADQAWAEAATTRKPVVVLFYAPRARACQVLEQILQTDLTAGQILSQFTPARANTDQLGGGDLAQRFGIYRVPTFLVMGFDGQTKGQATFDRPDAWPAVAAELQAALARAKANP